ncbi:MAG TPA: DUF885 domain-containing protein [Saprospiraceae bacterium]|nr:DUF885 domain-containing protein [Saprospiraceae bacterium]HMQ83323.1 DUF885 domain-containing protein [Saprospiraceae bacterium]
MKKAHCLYALLLLFMPPLSSQVNAWEQVVEQFRKDYEKLDLMPLRIAYVDNLGGIKEMVELQQQRQVFEHLRQELQPFDYQQLSEKQQIEYRLLQHHLLLNEVRIPLEEQWRALNLDTIPTARLAYLPNGKAWYTYFLQQWVDPSATPEALFDFGLSEIEKVQAKIKAIEQKSGMDSLAFQQYIQSDAFFYHQVDEVQQALEAYSARMTQRLPDYFPGMAEIPKLKIQRGQIERLAQVPGFYSDNTLYYNFFDRPFNKRQITWLYLHEALPGHHYEISYSRSHRVSPLQSLFNNPAYSEGWAAYVEEIGWEIGAYDTIYDELGKWEWDLIRSVRVPLDIGLNYYAWSDEQALAFWQKYISGQDDIGLREIARMKRWPCQVITYKYGADQLLRWKAQLEKQPGFDLKQFHEQVLQYGPLPFSILEPLLLKHLD